MVWLLLAVLIRHYILEVSYTDSHSGDGSLTNLAWPVIALDVSWNNVNDAGYWMVSLQDVSIGNTSLGISSDRVAIDTGTSLIGAPASAVDAIFAQVPGAVPSDDPNRKGYYYVSRIVPVMIL